MKNEKNQKGFSLIELLVVVIIIAIIAAIAIPSLLASRRAANQSSTVANLRTVVSANATHASLAAGGQYAATFAALSAADYIDDSWAAATVTKNGYTYTYTPTAAPIVGYCVSAVAAAGSGDFNYAVSHQGVIYQRPQATAASGCTAADGVIATGTVVGG